jgi:alpha-tubulin suppressor-like RCC1 family protein
MGTRHPINRAIFVLAQGIFAASAFGQGGGVVAWGFSINGQADVPPDLTNVVAIAAGNGNHSLALKADGIVVAWGRSTEGQCNVPSDLRAVAIDAGRYHSLALTTNGNVVAWGAYYTASGTIPAFVPPDLADVVKIAAGGDHNLALKRDGTVTIWGSSAYVTAVPEGLSNVIEIAAGALQNLALKDDGTVVVWGYSFESYFPPADLNNVVAISASYYNFAAMKSDGSIVLWGKDGYGQTTVPSGLANHVATIDAGLECYVALKNDGTAAAWGKNYFNQTNIPSLEERVIAISSGGGHTLALIQMGAAEITQQPADKSAYTGTSTAFEVRAFGSSPLIYQWFVNGLPIAGRTNPTLTIASVTMGDAGDYCVTISNRFGVVTSDTAALTPIDNPPVIVVQPVSRVGYPGRSASFSVTVDGSLPRQYQWRFNGTNIVGATNSALMLNPVTTNYFGRYSVVITNAFGGVESEEAELFPSAVFAWGDNSNGQTNVPPDLDQVVMLAGGASDSLAARNDGTVVAWGGGGQSVSYPWLTNTAAIAGRHHAYLVLLSDGTVTEFGLQGSTVATNTAAIAVGANFYLFLASNGTATAIGHPNYSPSPPPSATNLIAIAAGYYHGLGVRSDGSLLAWGSDFYGQITLPVSGVPFIDVAGGEHFSLGLRADGTTLGWGNNDFGQTNIPLAATNIVAIAAGARHAMALRQDGRIFVWGDTNGNRWRVPGELTFATHIAAGNNHNLALQGSGALRFLREPTSRTVRAGSRTLLNARAAGTGPIYYQWTRDGTNITGATNAYFTIPDTQEGSAGVYAAVIFNSSGSITSGVASVVVTPSAPLIDRDPQNIDVRSGQAAVITVTASGTDPLRFQWLRNGLDLPDKTNSALVIPDARLTDSGNYHVIVSNSLGQSTSAVARLRVYPLEALTTLVATNATGALAWGDYDNDGLLDLLVGIDIAAGKPVLFRNAGNGNFARVNVPFTSPAAAAVAWGDFDNDDYLDVITTDNTFGGQIWHNNRDGTFTLTNSGLAIDWGSTIALADFDSNGLLDVLIGGRLHRNRGGNEFDYIGTAFPVTEYSSNAWGDYDNDGLADVLLCGLMHGTARLLLYRNTGDGGFALVNSGLPQIYRGAVAWLDFDADGNLDVILSGQTGPGTRLTELYKNNGDSTFSRVQSDLPATTEAAITTGDYDNDGSGDIFLSGHNGLSHNGRLFQGHTDGLFTPIYSPFPSNTPCTVAWGDFNADGRLDLAMNTSSNKVALYQNYITAANTTPQPPLVTLVPVAGVNMVTFTWGAGSDVETQTPALTYNLRIGKSSGSGDVMSSDAAANGIRRIPQPGNGGPVGYKTITGLGLGRYYWAVQSVDSAFAGSAFTPEQIFDYAAATLPATDINTTKARLNGMLDTNRLPATAWFEWGTTTNYGNSTSGQTIGVSSNGLVASPINDLIGDTTYHFRLVVSNVDGLHFGGNQSFTTADFPRIVPQEPSGIFANGVTINALVNANGTTTGVAVEYGVTPALGTNTAPAIIGAERTFVPVNQSITNLIGGQLYHYRIVATNDAGTTYASNLTFITTSEPQASTLPASNVGPTSALLQASVAPNTLPSFVFFEYGTTTNYGSQSIGTNLAGSSTATAVALPVGGLARATVYHFRVVASNTTGVARGGDMAFTTTNDVIALPASNMGLFSATLNGLVNANGQETTANFEFGSTTNLGSVGAPVLVNGTTLVPLSLNLTNLSPDSSYFFRVAATNSEGFRQSSILSFRTLPVFSGTNGGIFGTSSGSTAWGDYDNDGRLDLLSGDTFSTRIYRNLGSGNFAIVGPNYPGALSGSVEWGDYNNDGWLDMLIVGALSQSSYVYRNNTNGSFTLIASNLVRLSRGAGRWGDFNNDGSQDILFVAETNGVAFTRLFRNSRDGSFSEVATSLPAYLDANAGTVDYDKDGKLDVLMIGRIGTEMTNVFTKLLRNLGGGNFEDSGVILPGVRLGFADWGDFDADGFPDLILGGQSAGLTNILCLYRNNGDGAFTDLTIGLPALAPDAALWGDYDNDGRLDVLARGQKSLPAPIPPHSLSAVFRNNGDGTFIATYFQLPELRFTSGGWADYSGDGRLDVLIAGRTRSGMFDGRLYRNNWPTVNVRPNSPQQLSAVVSSNTVTLAWNAGSDLQTPSATLTYNVRVGRSSQMGDVVSALSSATGERRIPALGNAGYRTNFILLDLPPGRYLWSVQAIDTAFAGSPFAAEQTFVITGPPIVWTLPPTNVSATFAMVRSAVTPGVAATAAWFQWGTTTNFGSVTEAVLLSPEFAPLSVEAPITGLSPDAIYYYCAVATNALGITFGQMQILQTVFPPTLIPVPGYSTNNFRQFQFLGAPGATYSVSSSTNLIDWVPMGPATFIGSNQFRFTDPASTNFPVRFYRVSNP